MTEFKRFAAMLGLLSLGCAGCRDAGPDADVAVSNSLLESAVRDLTDGRLRVLHLAEPGMCPMHVEPRPSQIRRLRTCRLLLRLDFQASLDAKLAPAGEAMRIAPVEAPGGLATPDTYLAVCRQTADALLKADLLTQEAAERRLEEISGRTEALTARCRSRVAGLAGTPVLCSLHQEAFCRWLGLRVVGTFRAADVETAGHVDEVVRAGREAGVKLVIANLPEGRRVADTLAHMLGANVAVFGNFPVDGESGVRFDPLPEGNVTALLEAAGS